METNAEYIDRCISAYLYNSPLVSRKDLMAFHNSRELQDDARLKMFNSIVSAAIDCSQNLVLEYKTEGEETPEDIKAAFMSSWDPDRYALAQQPSSEGVPVLAGPVAD